LDRRSTSSPVPVWPCGVVVGWIIVLTPVCWWARLFRRLLYEVKPVIWGEDVEFEGWRRPWRVSEVGRIRAGSSV
jgi:hypothetical protein